MQKVAHQLYAVAATNNGFDYDFVGNFGTLTEANKAGRQYVCDRSHTLIKRNTLEMEAA